MSKRFYRVLDRGQTFELQEAELMKTCGGWRYFRCVKSGCEWHENGARLAPSPESAFWYYYNDAMARLRWLADDAWMKKIDNFPEIRRLVGRLEFARQEIAKLRTAGHLGR